MSGIPDAGIRGTQASTPSGVPDGSCVDEVKFPELLLRALYSELSELAWVRG